jgi:hypothetical protein
MKFLLTRCLLGTLAKCANRLIFRRFIVGAVALYKQKRR